MAPQPSLLFFANKLEINNPPKTTNKLTKVKVKIKLSFGVGFSPKYSENMK